MSCVWYEESQDRHYTVLTIYYNQQNTNCSSRNIGELCLLR